MSNDEMVRRLSGVLAITLGTVTIKGAVTPVDYNFTKYPGKFLKYGPNVLNQALPESARQQHQLVAAGIFDAGKAVLSANGLADEKGVATLIPIQQNLATLLCMTDPVSANNTNRTLALVAKNTIAGEDSATVTLANSLVIDLAALSRIIVDRMKSKTPSFGKELIASDAAFIFNISFDAVTADVSIDSVVVPYGISLLTPMGNYKKFKDYLGWHTITLYPMSLFDAVTPLAGIDFSATKK